MMNLGRYPVVYIKTVVETGSYQIVKVMNGDVQLLISCNCSFLDTVRDSFKPQEKQHAKAGHKWRRLVLVDGDGVGSDAER